nr:MAG TPA: hypothetical protein [Caudoviricetes sp.]
MPVILLLKISSYAWLRNKSTSSSKNAGHPP